MDPKVILAALAVLLLAGCTTTQTGSLCSVGPFRPDAGVTERWTRGEKEYLVTLNDSGETVCGWRP